MPCLHGQLHDGISIELPTTTKSRLGYLALTRNAMSSELNSCRSLHLGDKPSELIDMFTHWVPIIVTRSAAGSITFGRGDDCISNQEPKRVSEGFMPRVARSCSISHLPSSRTSVCDHADAAREV